MKNKYSLLLPAAVFASIVFGSYVLSNVLREREQAYSRTLIAAEASKTEDLINAQIESELRALKRMARRWSIANGTPFPIWKDDAAAYVAQLDGLQFMKWVDPTNHIRWAEPSAGAEGTIGFDVMSDLPRAKAIIQASKTNAPAATEPLKLLMGGNGFICYIPVSANGNPDGFLSAVFLTKPFFDGAISTEKTRNYRLSVSYNGTVYYSNNIKEDSYSAADQQSRNIRVFDQVWQLNIAPTKDLINSQQTALPLMVLLAGLIIAVLSAIALGYMRISAYKSRTLAKSNLFNAAILSSAKYLVIATDIDGKIIVFNKAAEHALQYKAAELIGLHTPARFHDLQEIRQRAIDLSVELNEAIAPGPDVFFRKLRDGGTETRDWIFIRKDGTRFPGSATASELRDETGGVTGYLGIIEDISSRRQAEDNLHAAERFQNLVIENMPAYVFVKDRDFRIVQANSAFLSIYPLELQSSVIGSTTVEQFDKAEAEIFLEKDREAFIQGHSECLEHIVFPDGIKRIVNSKKIRFYDATGEPFILGVSQDITEQHQSELNRSQLLDKLMQSNTDLERFAYVASHDMQEPLRMITNFSEIINNDYRENLDDTGREYLTLIHDASSRMRLMINDLLEFARIGNQVSILTAVDTARELKHVMQNLRELLIERDVQITFDPLPLFHGNAIQFTRLLQNLITNAIKYQPKGNKPIIHIGVEDQGLQWCITVKDNGLGIGEKFLQQVFQPFRRLHSWSAIKGTGIGLAICEKIVTGFGGRIWVTSTVGKGSIFHFTVNKMRPSSQDSE